MNKDKKILLLAIFPAVLILLLSLFNLVIIMLGTTITIKANPIDPTDLFRGDFVVLNYEISEIDVSLINISNLNNLYDKTVYVSLKEDTNGYYIADIVEEKIPKSGIYLKGKINRINYKYPDYDYDDYDDYYYYDYDKIQISTVEIDYGIDTYYVKENTGFELERKENLIAKITVYKGKAVIREVY